MIAMCAKDDWGKLLPMVAMAINNRDASSTGLSLFFFTYGYHVELLGELPSLDAKVGFLKASGEAFVKRMKEATVGPSSNCSGIRMMIRSSTGTGKQCRGDT